MKQYPKAVISVGWSTEFQHLVLTTPAGLTRRNCAFTQTQAAALIEDILTVYRALWPAAPTPEARA